MQNCDFVFHLVANADIRCGLEHPRRDLEQNTLATFNVLEAMRANGITRIAFASSAAVLGEPTLFPTPEDCPFPIQTSLYGASKRVRTQPCSSTRTIIPTIRTWLKSTMKAGSGRSMPIRIRPGAT